LLPSGSISRTSARARRGGKEKVRSLSMTRLSWTIKAQMKAFHVFENSANSPKFAES
jgi:hypothetical protein